MDDDNFVSMLVSPMNRSRSVFLVTAVLTRTYKRACVSFILQLYLSRRFLLLILYLYYVYIYGRATDIVSCAFVIERFCV